MVLKGRPLACGIVRDITARQQADQVLRRREQELPAAAAAEAPEPAPASDAEVSELGRAVEVALRLVSGGAEVRAFDPTVHVPDGVDSVAVPGIDQPSDDGGSLLAYPDAYAACRGAAAVVVLTEWDEFRWLDFVKVREALAAPVLVDARNLLDPAQVRRLGFSYTGIGRR